MKRYYSEFDVWRFGLNWIRRGLRLAAPSLLFAEWTRRATTARGCYDCCRLSSECDQKKTDQVRQFSQLQDENARLKRLVAELSLDKTMLQDVLAKKL